MGLFDGIPAEPGRSGSAADLARLFGLPVLLVLDVSGQSQTAAAIAKGFASYDPAVRIAGVVLNRLGSERHRRLAGDAIEALGIPVVGAVMRDPTLTLPERHLGLVQAGEHADIDAHIERLADMMERSIDIDKVLELMTPLEPQGGDFSAALPPPGQRIALAEDAAFSFLYPHVARHWRKAGAEIVPFSPLADEAPDESCDVCWLPGGYPGTACGKTGGGGEFPRRDEEVRARRSRCMASAAASWCSGKGWSMRTASGTQMLGLLGHATSFAKRKMNLGYRQARLTAGSALGPAGAEVRGHEFHYAQVIEPGADEPLAEIADGQGNALGASGGRRGHVSGTFFHAIARADAMTPRRIADDIALCLVFFTRLPLPAFDFRGRTLARGDLGSAAGRRRGRGGGEHRACAGECGRPVAGGGGGAGARHGDADDRLPARGRAVGRGRRFRRRAGRASKSSRSCATAASAPTARRRC